MILMNDFKAEPRALRDSMLSAVSRVIESGWFVLGNEVEKFEREWAQVCGATDAIGVGNGMDAIEIALRTLGVGSGDEVITTPMTAFASVLAIIRVGATPVLADIDKDTGLLSIESVNRCVSKRTKAVLLVHVYGQIRSMLSWQKLCDSNNIYLIEDCAQSHLASLNGKVAGTFGRIGAYSFYPTKNLGALGDAGAIVTNDGELAEHARCLRNYGQSERYYHPEIGMNSRLDEMQAAILSIRLKWLSEFTIRRQEIAQIYFDNLNNELINTMSQPEEAAAHVYHLFVITSQKRNTLQEHLEDAGVKTLIHYPVPIHYQEPCKNIKQDKNGLKMSEIHAKTCLSLPCHPQMSNDDVNKVVDAVNTFRGK